MSEQAAAGDASSQQQPKSFVQNLGDRSPNKALRISLVWQNISLAVMAKDTAKSSLFHTVHKKKHILKGISGHAKSGELLAIMGPTGCGKTSLMNILAARVAGLKAADTQMSGSIFVNGQPRDDPTFRKISAYVLQDDRLYPHLTVHETLLISAHFFLPDDVSPEQKEQLVSSVIQELGLIKARDTIIGDEKVRGVSGGERKRANIAVQLISDPAVLFLDEPTSGLDSFQAQAVMEAMKNMSLNGRLVITVIHQPRSSIFDMFDQLLLLSEGQAIYLGDARLAGKHFNDAGYPVPKFFNPADYFLDVLSPDTRTPELDQAAQQRIGHLSQYWIESTKDKDLFSTRASQVLQDIPGIPMTFTRFVRNFRILYWRSFSEVTRSYVVTIFKCVLSTFFACIIGWMYNNIANDQESIYNREGLLFIVVLNQGFSNVTATATIFPKEKVIVNRERSTNAYDTLSYFLAKFFAELPLNLLPGCIFSCILYWIVGLNHDRFGYFLLIVLLEVVTAISLGLLCSALASSDEMATAIAIPMMIIPLLFGGFYINLDSLPIVANWLPWASFLRWTFQALVINEFKGETFTCSGGSTSACLTTGDEVIASLAFDKQSLSRAVLGMGCCLMIFFGLAILILEINRLKFLPLPHTGRRFASVKGQENEDIPVGISGGRHADGKYTAVLPNERAGENKGNDEGVAAE